MVTLCKPQLRIGDRIGHVDTWLLIAQSTLSQHTSIGDHTSGPDAQNTVHTIKMSGT